MPDLGPVTLRLKTLRNAAGLTVRATADALEISSSSYALYEDTKRYKKSLIPVPLARQLAELFERHGVERAHVLALAGIDADGAVQQTPDALAAQLDAVMLPELEVGYSMGGGSPIEDFQVVQHVPFSRSWLSSLTDSSPDQLFVARGDGDSMMPTILDQDIVIIDRGQKTMRQQDRIWAVMYGGFGMIKRVRGLPNGTIQINSDNPAVSAIEATEDETFMIGRVVAIIRRI